MSYENWVKKLGQWHLSKGNMYRTLCGQPKLGNNYADAIPIKERTKCPECFKHITKEKNNG